MRRPKRSLSEAGPSEDPKGKRVCDGVSLLKRTLSPWRRLTILLGRFCDRFCLERRVLPKWRQTNLARVALD